MLIANESVEVLRVEIQDGEVRRPKKLFARALPMRPAMAWLKEAGALEAQLNTDEGVLALAEFIAGYDPAWPAEAILERCSGPQVMEAFYALKDMNDPLAVARKRAAEEQGRGLRMIEALGKANPDGLAALVDRASSNASAKTSTPSGNGSV